MEESIATTFILPASLFIIMLGMGLSLEINDFKRIIVRPRAIAVGLINQLILLPLLAFTLAVSLGVDAEIAVGLMILAACPGGPTSNLITHVAKGDTALSVSLTAINSVITVFTIPFIVNFSLGWFLEESQYIHLPVLDMIMKIFVITILPVSIGMFIRSRKLSLAQKLEKPTRIASIIIFLVILIGLIATNIDIIVENFPKLGSLTAALNVLTIGIGFFTALLFHLSLSKRISIAVETGIQNGTLAIVIASSILLKPVLSLPAVIYGLVMFISSAIIMWYFGRRKA